MKTVLSISSLALAAFISSCVPYEEPPPLPPTRDDVAMNDERPPTTLEEAESRKRQREREAREARREESPPERRETIPETIDDPEPPAPEPPRQTMQVARPVPGKAGFVFSPFNNKIIDVKGIPSGTLVADPTYPASEKKYFRVP